MVNALTSTNVLNQKTTTLVKQDDIKNLIKYANNEALQETPDTFVSTMKGSVVNVGINTIPLLGFLKNVRKTNVLASSNGSFAIKDAMKNLDNKTFSAFKNVFKGKEGSFTSRFLDFIQTSTEVQDSFRNLQQATKTSKKATKLQQKLTKKVAKGKIISPKASDKFANLVKNAVEQTDYFVNPKAEDLKNAKKALDAAQKALTENPTSKKLQKIVDKAAKKVGNLEIVASGTKQVGKLGKFKNFMKKSNAGFMLAFSGIAEFLGEVVPTFQELGVKKGLKQLAKSSVKVVSDTAGFVLGEQTFMAIGSAIGTAICPGIGTAVGVAFGAIGGMLGSFIAGKLTNPIVGKTEREIAKDQAQQEQARLLQTDTVALNELKNTVEAKLQQETANGTLNEDSTLVLQSLENIKNSNPFAA